MKNTVIKENIFSVLKHPRITEKASMLMERGVYSFNVPDSATKMEIKKAIFGLYKVKLAKIAIVKVPKKSVFIRGRKGSKSGGKKAYVYLKKGDKIELS